LRFVSSTLPQASQVKAIKMLLQLLKFLVVYSIMLKMLVKCSEVFLNDLNDEPTMSGLVEDSGVSGVAEENSVLDSVYDTMKHNFEVKLQQNLNELNLISDIRNKRNVNEAAQANSVDYFKNHQYEVNRKAPVNFPLGFKSPPRLLPITNPMPPMNQRNDYYEEEVLVDCSL